MIDVFSTKLMKSKMKEIYLIFEKKTIQNKFVTVLVQVDDEFCLVFSSFVVKY